MDRGGFIREKIDIKILILFVLQRLPEAVSLEELWPLVHCDEGFGYFEFVECLGELHDTGHVRVEKGAFTITEKGIRNGGAVESSIPYSARAKAERAALFVARKMKRDAMISTSRDAVPEGGIHLSMSLSDGVGEIIGLKLLVPREEDASLIEKNFRSGAENIYSSIVELLSTWDTREEPVAGAETE